MARRLPRNRTTISIPRLIVGILKNLMVGKKFPINITFKAPRQVKVWENSWTCNFKLSDIFQNWIFSVSDGFGFSLWGEGRRADQPIRTTERAAEPRSPLKIHFENSKFKSPFQNPPSTSSTCITKLSLFFAKTSERGGRQQGGRDNGKKNTQPNFKTKFQNEIPIFTVVQQKAKERPTTAERRGKTERRKVLDSFCPSTLLETESRTEPTRRFKNRKFRVKSGVFVLKSGFSMVSLKWWLERISSQLRYYFATCYFCYLLLVIF